MATAPRVLLLCALTLTSACWGWWDFFAAFLAIDERAVADLRVLGLRASHVEIHLAPADRPDLLDGEFADVEVELEALVVDPRGGEAEVDFRFCVIPYDPNAAEIVLSSEGGLLDVLVAAPTVSCPTSWHNDGMEESVVVKLQADDDNPLGWNLAKTTWTIDVGTADSILNEAVLPAGTQEAAAVIVMATARSLDGDEEKQVGATLRLALRRDLWKHKTAPYYVSYSADSVTPWETVDVVEGSQLMHCSPTALSKCAVVDPSLMETLRVEVGDAMGYPCEDYVASELPYVTTCRHEPGCDACTWTLGGCGGGTCGCLAPIRQKVDMRMAGFYAAPYDDVKYGDEGALSKRIRLEGELIPRDGRLVVEEPMVAITEMNGRPRYRYPIAIPSRDLLPDAGVDPFFALPEECHDVAIPTGMTFGSEAKVRWYFLAGQEVIVLTDAESGEDLPTNQGPAYARLRTGFRGINDGSTQLIWVAVDGEGWVDWGTLDIRVLSNNNDDDDSNWSIL